MQKISVIIQNEEKNGGGKAGPGTFTVQHGYIIA